MGHGAVVTLTRTPRTTEVGGCSHRPHGAVVVTLLVDTDGINVDLKDNKGWTLLFLVVENGYEGVAWLLSRTNGIDLSLKILLGECH